MISHVMSQPSYISIYILYFVFIMVVRIPKFSLLVKFFV